VPVTHEQVRAAVDSYALAYPHDTDHAKTVLGWLDAGGAVTSRAEMRGHVTVAAVLLDDRDRVLYVHHKLFDRMLLPGGHVEDEDSGLAGAALRELVEEAGLEGAAITLAWPDPIHMDIHPMPARPDKNEGAHMHVDFRYLFRLDRPADVTLQEEEVIGYEWRDVSAIHNDDLRDRVGVFLSE
jgi:8-oxo-dGTP pyrophosphatase MutT (NUDIX family)